MCQNVFSMKEKGKRKRLLWLLWLKDKYVVCITQIININDTQVENIENSFSLENIDSFMN